MLRLSERTEGKPPADLVSSYPDREGVQGILFVLNPDHSGAPIAELGSGGRFVHGPGFAMLLVCPTSWRPAGPSTTLGRPRTLPIAIPQNVTLVDPNRTMTVYVGPDPGAGGERPGPTPRRSRTLADGNPYGQPEGARHDP